MRVFAHVAFEQAVKEQIFCAIGTIFSTASVGYNEPPPVFRIA